MKNIIVTMIAGSLFAASVVAPAFATNTGATGGADVASRQQPVPNPLDGLPDVKVPDRIPGIDTIGERLKNLDLGTVLDKNDISLPVPLELPDRLPDLERPTDVGPVEIPDLERLPDIPVNIPDRIPEVEPTAPTEPDVAGEPDDAAEVEPEIEEKETGGRANGPKVPVKEIVAETKAEKASIFAAHGGDRRAAKAELKAAQMRMVARIKANNGAGGKGAGKARGKGHGKKG